MIETVSLNIRCLNRPNFDESEFERFLDGEGVGWNRESDRTAADNLVEASGRLCYMSFGHKKQSPRSNSEYILNLIKQGHESVLEHISWTFLITGVSRAFTHQLVRHRVGFSYSQLSQQYHDESDAKFVIPPTIKDNPSLLEKWVCLIESNINFYKESLSSLDDLNEAQYSSKKENLRDIRSASRSVLPNATESKIIVTANARALRHFFKMRGAIEGDWEMRSVACMLFKIVSRDAPATFQDFSIDKTSDGYNKLVKSDY